MLMMFFAEFSAESADILHESEPTAQMKMELEIMRKNYDPLN